MIGSENVKVNGLALPSALVDVIRTGRWIAPTSERIRKVFPLAQTAQPLFYKLESIQRENALWRDEIRSAPYRGRKGGVQPGDIDPTKAVLIADLGPDELVCLDYRASEDKPSVVYLAGDEESRWIEVAPDIETLLTLLDIGSKSTEIRTSPRILNISWGRIEVERIGVARDIKLYPGGGREWDWRETDTHHVPGIQPADVLELLDKGSKVVVLTRGMHLALHTCRETLEMLREKNIRFYVEETTVAVEIYNGLVEKQELVGGLFHSTC
jgi:hypothetical protein